MTLLTTNQTQRHLIDIEKCFILEIKTDIEKFSKRQTPPISGQFFLHQRYPLIGENSAFHSTQSFSFKLKKEPFKFSVDKQYRKHSICDKSFCLF